MLTSVIFQALKSKVLSSSSHKMGKSTTSALREIVASVREPLLAISVAATTAVNNLNKLEAALVSLENQELTEAVRLLPTSTSLSDSSDSEGPFLSPTLIELSLTIPDQVSPILPTSLIPPTLSALSSASLGRVSPTSPTLSNLSSASLGWVSPTSPTSPTLSNLSSTSLGRELPTSPTSPILTLPDSLAGIGFTITESLPRICWRPAPPPPPEEEDLNPTASLTLPTLSAPPTKSATPTQGLPTSPLSEPPPRPLPAPATTRPPPDTNNVETISLPFGWEKRCVRRPDGKNKGRWDVYLRPPIGNQLRSKSQLRQYLEKHPEVPHDATVTNFCRRDIPADKEVIASAAPKSPPQPPRSPRGRNHGRRLSQAASQNLTSDGYIDT